MSFLAFGIPLNALGAGMLTTVHHHEGGDNMKVWVISVLLLVLVGLAVSFVTADESNPEDIVKETLVPDTHPFKTPADIKYTRDLLAPVKEVIGMEVKPVDITIDDQWVASIPEDSPLFDVPITKECLNRFPYGTIQEVRCELGDL
jgi:hypothetical protein